MFLKSRGEGPLAPCLSSSVKGDSEEVPGVGLSCFMHSPVSYISVGCWFLPGRQSLQWGWTVTADWQQLLSISSSVITHGVRKVTAAGFRGSLQKWWWKGSISIMWSCGLSRMNAEHLQMWNSCAAITHNTSTLLRWACMERKCNSDRLDSQ